MNLTKLPGTMTINTEDHLTIGGIDTVLLADKYQTPLFVYDIALIRERCREFKETFERKQINAQVAYASKAFSCLAIYQLMAQEGMSLDVVSGGELYTAIQAGFPSEKIHFHGNNKTKTEMNAALDYQIGCFVVDNFNELTLLNQLASQKEHTVKILIRVTPGVEAHTHDYISTGQEDSKFGFDLMNGQAEQAVIEAMNLSNIELIGLHSHIGSQIFESDGFLMAIDKLLSKTIEWQKAFGFHLSVLNLGGGFGIRYTKEDQPLAIPELMVSIIDEVILKTTELGIPMPEIWLEPGRSLVGDAGTTLYETGSQKEVPNVRNYLAVDGGMSDNIRPALYDAKYTGILANRATEQPTATYSIAGKCCESGDMLIWDLPLPKVQEPNVLAVFSTGAYGYSMASNYNRIPRPAVVFVENNIDFLAIRRETYADVMQLDIPFPTE
ncbi:MULTISPECIES: diaminopimelate decarboxylase [Carnobacterium]|uniref:diaminopimelate decarboxylase n=1 Tax=Carnobacterium TaxID=2747 RepID=UPI00288D55D9|nr:MULTISPECIES: diaminopimelate decarboxylase [Carnobacterium]MDT1938937.1 diaminopimelate decarboxylase [Carnobacterium divergens]MDT1941375.1 diaminopimelate decarboxylase [Carnobacterium divergens]MDT1947173.1 diaminopimelate decarboxylase [Carnobacterium divergens]MDT1949611.1 diaminopimelate decarboxylase [Carnobacterium divergens]MDT1954789.1 diaminopimelate decarboxylase [Carnobacterium divergens]